MIRSFLCLTVKKSFHDVHALFLGVAHFVTYPRLQDLIPKEQGNLQEERLEQTFLFACLSLTVCSNSLGILPGQCSEYFYCLKPPREGSKNLSLQM